MGFVRQNPQGLKQTTILGSNEFKVKQHEFAVIDTVNLGQSPKSDSFREGKYAVPREWFSAKESTLTIFDVGIVSFTEAVSVPRTFRSDGAAGEGTLDCTATVECQLNETHLRALLSSPDFRRDAQSLAEMESRVRQMIRDGIEEALARTHLKALLAPGNLTGPVILRTLQEKKHLRERYAVDIRSVSGVKVRPSFAPVFPPADQFLLYSGPLDLCPNCRLFSGERQMMVKLEAKDQEVIVFPGRQTLIGPNAVELRDPPFNEPGANVVVLSTAVFTLRFDFMTSHDSLDAEGAQQQLGIAGEVRYQISSTDIGALSFYTLADLPTTFSNIIGDQCKEIVQTASVPDLRDVTPLGAQLSRTLVEGQPFLRSLGIKVISARIDTINGAALMPAFSITKVPVQISKAEQLRDRTTRHIAIPIWAVGVIITMEGARLLKPGNQYQYSQLGITATSDVKLISLEGESYDIDYRFNPMIRLPDGAAQLSASVQGTVTFIPDTNSEEEITVAQVLLSLPVDPEQRKKQRLAQVQELVRRSYQRSAATLISNNPRDLEPDIAELSFGLPSAVKISLSIVNVRHPEELSAAVLTMQRSRLAQLEAASRARVKLIETAADAESRRYFAEVVPPFTPTMLLQQGSEGIRDWASDVLKVLTGVVDRTGSVAQMRDAAEQLMGTLGAESNASHISSGNNLEQNLQQVITASEQRFPNALSVDEVEARDTPRRKVLVTPAPPELTTTEEVPSHLMHEIKQPPLSALPEQVIRDLAVCRELRGVATPPPTDDMATIVVSFPDGPVQRVWLQLVSFEGYPHVGPRFTRKCRVRLEDDSEREIRPQLDTVNNWHDQRTLREVVEEVIRRHGQIWIEQRS